MGKTLLLIAILSATLLLACGSAQSAAPAAQHAISASATPAPFPPQSSRDSIDGFGFSGPAGAAGPAGPAGATGEFFADLGLAESERAGLPKNESVTLGNAIVFNGDGTASTTLQTTQRQIISNASLSIEVEPVEPAIDQVRAIAEGLGGFVEQLSSYGSDKDQQANLTVRVPQDQFFTAVDRIEALGKVQGRNLGSEDVSEQFIDLEARLKSSLREEESLLGLLERAEKVAEILTIERELSRVRSDIERAQGQLNFLERRVDLSTISVSLFPPGSRLPEPPSASLLIEDSNVAGRVAAVRSLTASLKGEIDQVLLTTIDGKENAQISFRVFPNEFDQALTGVESQGKIVNRRVREGFTSTQAQTESPEDPNARIDVMFTEPAGSSYLWLKILIAVALVGVILAVAFYLTFRAGRNRTDRFIQSTA